MRFHHFHRFSILWLVMQLRKLIRKYDFDRPIDAESARHVCTMGILCDIPQWVQLAKGLISPQDVHALAQGLAEQDKYKEAYAMVSSLSPYGLCLARRIALVGLILSRHLHFLQLSQYFHVA